MGYVGSISPNTQLITGQTLTSPSGTYYLTQQADGNLVIYNTSTGKPIWALNMNGMNVPFGPGGKTVYQSDGNLCYYSLYGITQWCSGTSGKVSTSLQMQDNGNLVIMNGTTPVWSTNTGSSCTGVGKYYTYFGSSIAQGTKLGPCYGIKSPNGKYIMVQQSDGNLVVYNTTTNSPLWALNTNGINVTYTPGGYAVYQTDGNFCSYSPSGSSLWCSKTNGQASNALTIQDDGNVVLFKGTTPIWSTINLVLSGSGTTPYPVSVNDMLNQAITTTNCVSPSSAASQAAGLIPLGGEYDFAGTTGSCNMCQGCTPLSMLNPTGCDSNGRCGISGGVIPQYKRIAYNGDPINCCTSGVSTDGNNTCDPKYRSYNSSRVNNECASVMDSFCNNPTNYSANAYCQANYKAIPNATKVAGFSPCSAACGGGTQNSTCSIIPSTGNVYLRPAVLSSGFSNRSYMAGDSDDKYYYTQDDCDGQPLTRACNSQPCTSDSQPTTVPVVIIPSSTSNPPTSQAPNQDSSQAPNPPTNQAADSTSSGYSSYVMLLFVVLAIIYGVFFYSGKKNIPIATNAANTLNNEPSPPAYNS